MVITFPANFVTACDFLLPSAVSSIVPCPRIGNVAFSFYPEFLFCSASHTLGRLCHLTATMVSSLDITSEAAPSCDDRDDQSCSDSASVSVDFESDSASDFDPEELDPEDFGSNSEPDSSSVEHESDYNAQSAHSSGTVWWNFDFLRKLAEDEERDQPSIPFTYDLGFMHAMVSDSDSEDDDDDSEDTDDVLGVVPVHTLSAFIHCG